jgi:hypothetical protein
MHTLRSTSDEDRTGLPLCLRDHLTTPSLPSKLRARALGWVAEYMHAEDFHTNIGPVNKSLNMLSAFVYGGLNLNDENFQRHRKPTTAHSVGTPPLLSKLCSKAAISTSSLTALELNIMKLVSNHLAPYSATQSRQFSC